MSPRLTARTALLLFVTLVLAIAGGGPAAPAAHAAAPRALPAAGDEQWWFAAWAVDRIWATGAQGQGVTVAVVDTGIDATRPELKGVVVPGEGPDQGLTDSDTARAHGTAMARLIAGQGDGVFGGVGVAPRAKVMPIPMGESMTNLPEGIRFAVDHGAKVINMSLTSGSLCSSDIQQKQMYAAIRYAIDKGALLVAASGNSRDYTDTYPASCPGVIAVGASDSKRKVWSDSFAAPYVSFVAPGVAMASIDAKGQKVLSRGTSDSAALISGALALIWSKYPQLTNRQVLARLIATARDENPPGRDDLTGFGTALPLDALTKDIPLDAPNPVFDALDKAIPPGAGTSAPSASAGSSVDAGGAPTTGDGETRVVGPESESGGGVLPLVLGGIAVLIVGGLIGAWIARTNKRRNPTP